MVEGVANEAKVDKCKVIHFGRTNNRDKYYMEDSSSKWTNIDFTGPAQGMRGNRLRLRREAFKSSARNKFAMSVTQRHNFFTKRVTLS